MRPRRRTEFVDDTAEGFVSPRRAKLIRLDVDADREPSPRDVVPIALTGCTRRGCPGRCYLPVQRCRRIEPPAIGG